MTSKGKPDSWDTVFLITKQIHYLKKKKKTLCFGIKLRKAIPPIEISFSKLISNYLYYTFLFAYHLLVK